MLAPPTSPSNGGDRDDYRNNRIGAAQKKDAAEWFVAQWSAYACNTIFHIGIGAPWSEHSAETSILSVIQLNQLCFDIAQTCGPAILIAVLLQSISGALLPWTVEEAPALFWSIYIATGSDGDGFGQMLRASTKITASASFGGIPRGSCLQESIASNGHIKSFLSQTKEVCNKGKRHLQLFM